ncbi:hypothetical protein FAI40_07970 [Acetobacteraceae bacterium]|nr:hypothetical protein FAI40_07970 [Acetobacteraceae bacterium]
MFPHFPLGKLARKIHPKSGFGGILSFAKDKAREEIKKTNELLQESPWKKNNSSLPQEIKNYLQQLEEIQNGDGNISENNFSTRPDILFHIHSLIKKTEDIKERIHQLNEAGTPIPDKIKKMDKELETLWTTGQGNIDKLIFFNLDKIE